jgi:16S rRNA (uracil1498-N3)-methyltransferase
MDHWNKLMISACEQSGRTRLPKLSGPQHCGDWYTPMPDARAYLFVPGKQPIGEYLAKLNEHPTEVSLAIGPEGGFAEDEVKLLLQCGFEALSLGPRVLRTETAPLVAISLFQHILGDIN